MGFCFGKLFPGTVIGDSGPPPVYTDGVITETFPAMQESFTGVVFNNGSLTEVFSAIQESFSGLVLNTLEITRTTGSDTWTSPNFSGDTLVQCKGAGAGGLVATRAGGGGAHANKLFAFSPSTGYARVSGTAGAAGGTAGGNSTFNSTTCVAEGGGQSGTSSDGGRASASTGDTKYDGGAGGVGAGTVGGGGSAGSAGAGVLNAPGNPCGAAGKSAANTTMGPGAGGRSSAAQQGAGGSGRVRNLTRVPSAGVVPERVGISEYRANASTTHDLSLFIPTGVSVGDRITVYMSIESNPSITWTAFNAISSAASGTTVTGAVYERGWTGTETAADLTVTLGSSQELVAYIEVKRNAQATTASNATGSSVSPNPPNHAPGAGTYLYYAMIAITSASGSVTGNPANYDGMGVLPALTNAGPQLVLLWRELNASSEDPGTFTTSTGAWVAITGSCKR